MPVGEDATIVFDIDDDFAEYKINFTRQNSSDDITITDIAVYSTDEEPTGMQSIENGQLNSQRHTLTGQTIDNYYDLQGRHIKSSKPSKGLYVANGRKVVVN